MTRKAIAKMSFALSIGRKHWRRALEAERMYRLPPEDLDKYLQQALTGILRRAASRVPYYQRVFQERGWNPIVAEEYWSDWPILTQQMLQEHRDDLVADDVDKGSLWLNSSGGSSGFLKTFYQGQAYRASATPAAYWSDYLAGWRPGARVARLWGSGKDVTRARGLRSRLRLWLRNETLYNSFDMDEGTMLYYHKDLERFAPDFIVAYTGSAHQFAQFLKDNNIKPTYPRVSVITSAETLTETTREQIEEVFGVPVYDRYGSREVGLMSAECEAHCGLHCATLHNYIEVVAPGTLEKVLEREGDVLVTTLGNTDAPLIRYLIGDIAVASKEICSCGRNSLLLRRIIGASRDFIKTPDGRKIYGDYFTHLLYGMSSIRQFRLVQKRLDWIEIELVVTEALSENQRSCIVASCKEVLSPKVHVKIKEVDKIPPLASGKRAFTISEIED